MDTHPAFSTTDCEVNIIDWDRIDGHDWSLKEQILVEVLRFITSDESNVQLEDLLTLTQLEQQAVLVSLNVALTTQSLEENLAHD
jgi:hypothetical protein